jgi:nucleotide-binding universal stress UspA family protein
MKTIVVGIDGSDRSRRALEWALSHAPGDARLRLVHAYDVGVASAAARMGGLLELEDLEKHAREHAEQVVADLLAAVQVPAGVEIERDLVQTTQPAEALLDRARDADLLVVGSRGHGGFTGLLLGSVSQQCVQHAPCPVVVLPAAAR